MANIFDIAAMQSAIESFMSRVEHSLTDVHVKLGQLEAQNASIVSALHESIGRVADAATATAQAAQSAAASVNAVTKTTGVK